MNLFRRVLPVTIVAAVVCGTAVSQAPSNPSGLEPVLKKMDAAAATFRTTQADFEWDRYEKVIDEIDDIQSGTVYYRRVGKEVEMKADIKKPEAKHVLFSNGKIQVYQPKPDQVTTYGADKNRADIETYLVLGFGGSGQDLMKAFDVSYQGAETINSVATAKLQLIPKSQSVRNNIARILLWIDLDRGISLQQQLFEPQGDYRLAKYSNIRVNEKINSDVFQLKTTGKTQFISPKG
ncbi:MAG: outer membrane lipoprotein carrier protein LolA [Acidobacteriia bacterium]|nr:outer membrane lipoprotein carrier protein LolA [Terriglobia bacterium]